jgi:hypothetical protein
MEIRSSAGKASEFFRESTVQPGFVWFETWFDAMRKAVSFRVRDLIGTLSKDSLRTFS